MKKVSTSLERWVSTHFPNLFLKLVQQPRNYFRFRTERELSRGVTRSQSSHPSIIFFTTQKCASRYVDSVIARMAMAAGLVHADYDAYVTMVRLPKKQRPFSSESNMRTAFRQKGYYYGPIGTYRNIPDMENYRVVLQLRDPRDVLTSLYFSTAFSHAIINPKVIRRRKEALAMDIDSYALRAADEYLPIYNRYCDSLLEKGSILFLRYEDMVSDFSGWLNQLSIHLGLDGDTKTLKAIRNEVDFSVQKEDKFSHRRQITPGDYLRKLRPATIQQLNERFGSVLRSLGYRH